MLNYLSMAYLLSNISTEIYWNQTTIVEIIVGGWVVSFLDTVHLPARPQWRDRCDFWRAG